MLLRARCRRWSGCGLRAIEVPTHPRDGIDLDALEAAHRAARAAGLLADDQLPEPAGQPDARGDKKRALVELLARHGMPLIEDDVYGELYFGRQAAAAGQGLRQRGAGDALLVVLEEPGARLPHRLGGARAASRAGGRAAQADEHASIPTCPRRSRWPLPGTRRLRPPPAPAAHARWPSSRRNTSRRSRAHFPAGTRVTRPAGGYFLWVELPEGSRRAARCSGRPRQRASASRRDRCSRPAAASATACG